MEEIRETEYQFRRRLFPKVAPGPVNGTKEAAANVNHINFPILFRNLFLTITALFLLFFIIHFSLKWMEKYIWSAVDADRRKKVERKIPATAYKAEIEIQGTECTVCLGEFMAGENVRVLPKCRHGFHVKCIDKWIAINSTCPTCRSPLV